MELAVGDIQGLVLASYGLPHVRHLVLRIDSAAAARDWLGAAAVASGDLAIASSQAPRRERDVALNVGLTFAGLGALEILPKADLERAFRSFAAFREGAVARAGEVGDVDRQAPEHWASPLADTGAVHTLLTIHARTAALREDATRRLRAALAASGAFAELTSFDGDALPGERVHFGYRDGIAQPYVQGAEPPGAHPDNVVPTHHFVLADDERSSYYLPEPAELGRNGSFAAFRIIEQDAAAFEGFIRGRGGDPEWWAAKLCGRWRDGTPLVLSPDRPAQPLPDDQLDRFDYRSDPRGVRCPAGAHIRRTNPRDVPVLGGAVSSHRLIRRMLPYGPVYDPAVSDAAPVERGLIGFFVCADLRNQFEFVMHSWMQEGGFTPDLYFKLASRDPLSGHPSAPAGPYVIPMAAAQPIEVGLPAFTRTRGAAYVFLPSLRALRWIAEQAAA